MWCVWQGNQPWILCKLSMFPELLSHLSSSIFGTSTMYQRLPSLHCVLLSTTPTLGAQQQTQGTQACPHRADFLVTTQ